MATAASEARGSDMEASERETSIVYSDDSEYVEIFTCIRKDITAMKNKEQFELVEEGKYSDGTSFANFRIPRSKFDIGKAAKFTRNLTDEQRQERAARMQAVRDKKGKNADE